jgi:hypothetical protein
MQNNDPLNRLSDLLISPMESLELELKGWLDLRENADDKANFAKAALALANHGGGYIIIGLDERDDGAVEAPHRPENLGEYRQDLLNGIIQSYADPPFHVSSRLVTAPSGPLAGFTFPIVSIPGGHHVPVRAKRSGPNGQKVENNAIYIRKAGPKSEIPLTSVEWDQLLSRCMSNRRDELLDQIRGVISGAVSYSEASSEVTELEEWADACLKKWHSLSDTLPVNAASRCPRGYYWVAYRINGDLKSFPPAEFPEVLRRSVVRYTGWPPFWVPNPAEIAPYPSDGAVECWLGRQRLEREFSDPAHSDFWRISPKGFAFLLRGYLEDSLTPERHGGLGRSVVPGEVFDLTLPVWRMGEVMLHAEQLSRNLSDMPVSIDFLARFEGLSDRSLRSLEGSREIWSERIARQNSIELKTTVEPAFIKSNLPEIIHPWLSPLYSLFAFFELPMFLVSEELEKMKKH